MNFNSLDISSSALTAQRARMDVIAGNLANVNTTRQPDGSVGAYRRKQVVFAPLLNQAMESSSNSSSYKTDAQGHINLNPSVGGVEFTNNGRPLLKGGVSIDNGVPAQGVEVVNITDEGENATKLVYNPGHPDADENGYVEMPNINVVTEMVDMISATRAYEANMTSVSNFKTMFNATLRI
ncbi:MAG: flagellar basal body rod protein FlgC [Vampirovibrionia bacterium]